MKGHKAAIEGGKNTRLYAAWRKYGEPTIEVLGEFQNEKLAEEEIKAIKKFKTLMPSGYNMTPGGDVSPMTIPEVVAAFAKSKKGIRPPQKAFDAAMAATKGKKRPEDVVRRMSLNGSMRRPEVRAKQAATMATLQFKARKATGHALYFAKKQGRPFSDFNPKAA